MPKAVRSPPPKRGRSTSPPARRDKSPSKTSKVTSPVMASKASKTSKVTSPVMASKAIQTIIDPQKAIKVQKYTDGALFMCATVTLAVCMAEPAKAVAATVSHELSQHIASLSTSDLLGVGIAGFAAQIVDGSLGMGYGVTSSTVLVLAGLSPATASASVHLAQLGTTGVSGLAHHKFGNVDLKTLWLLSLPGALGAFVGATLLANIPGSTAKTVTATLLFSMGLRILMRGGKGMNSRAKGTPSAQFLVPLGLLGGFVDATGGGGWGPVATSGLLSDGRLPPKKAIGTVSASEFFVTVAAVLGFFFALNSNPNGSQLGEAVRLDLVLTLLAGGMIAAPLAPLFVAWLDARLLGVIVGGFVCLTTLRTLLKALGVSGAAVYVAYAAMLIVVGTTIARASGAQGSDQETKQRSSRSKKK